MFSGKETKKKFQFILLILILIAISASTGMGQILVDKKDLMFTQVFAGPAGSTNYMSSISVTNRGSRTYSGNLYFVIGENTPWDPRVNGSYITNGSMDITLQPDETMVYAVTSETFTVGYAWFMSDDYSLSNYIEGNLSYFSFGSSGLLDAVGVPESKEFLVSSLPFDMYSDVGLSLVNPSATAANIHVMLFTPGGGIAATCDFTLQAFEHKAQYLRELPWYNDPVGFGPVGKVEISVSNGVPIAGIAMLVTPGSAAGAQISTLPLGGTPLTYEATFTADGVVYNGDLALWIEGSMVKAYLQMTSVAGDGTPVDFSNTRPIILNGQLIGDELELTGTSWPANTWPGVSSIFGGLVYIYIANFDASTNLLGNNGNTWASYHVWDDDQAVERGKVVLDNALM